MFRLFVLLLTILAVCAFAQSPEVEDQNSPAPPLFPRGAVNESEPTKAPATPEEDNRPHFPSLVAQLKKNWGHVRSEIAHDIQEMKEHVRSWQHDQPAESLPDEQAEGADRQMTNEDGEGEGDHHRRGHHCNKHNERRFESDEKEEEEERVGRLLSMPWRSRGRKNHGKMWREEESDDWESDDENDDDQEWEERKHEEHRVRKEKKWWREHQRELDQDEDERREEDHHRRGFRLQFSFGDKSDSRNSAPPPPPPPAEEPFAEQIRAEHRQQGDLTVSDVRVDRSFHTPRHGDVSVSEERFEVAREGDNKPLIRGEIVTFSSTRSHPPPSTTDGPAEDPAPAPPVPFDTPVDPIPESLPFMPPPPSPELEGERPMPQKPEIPSMERRAPRPIVTAEDGHWSKGSDEASPEDKEELEGVAVVEPNPQDAKNHPFSPTAIACTALLLAVVVLGAVVSTRAYMRFRASKKAQQTDIEAVTVSSTQVRPSETRVLHSGSAAVWNSTL